MISSVGFIRNIYRHNVRTYYSKIKEAAKDKEARKLDKMFAKAMQKKNSCNRTNSMLKVSVMEPDTNDGISRKGTALNKVYMEHMTELIQSGQYSRKILKEGFEITGMKLIKGGDYINIYYTCLNEKLTEETIDEMLRLAAKELQEQMGNIRYVAKTPFVRFFRDLKMERAQNVEKILQTADFGPDYKPLHPESVITPDCNLSEDGLPEMRQDVFGIDHAKIKAKILTAMEIHKVTHTPKENEFAYEESDNLIPFDKKAFVKFYKRKRILDRKLTSRGLFGWRRSNLVEEADESEDDDYAKEFWESIKKEQEEELKEYSKYED